MRIAIFFCFFVLSIACQSEQRIQQLPFTSEKAVAVLTDAYIAEGAIQNLSPEIKDSLIQVYYEQVYQIHDITSEEFDALLQAIQNNPVLADSTYQKVLNRLDELEKEVKTRKEKK